MNEENILLFYQIFAAFWGLALWQLCERLGVILQKPLGPEDSKQSDAQLSRLKKFLLTPMLLLMIYFALWSLDIDHRRLRSPWTWSAATLTFFALLLENRALRGLKLLGDGVGGAAGKNLLAFWARSVSLAGLLLFSLWWLVA